MTCSSTTDARDAQPHAAPGESSAAAFMPDLPDSLRADIADDLDDVLGDLGSSVTLRRGGVDLGTVTAYVSSAPNKPTSNSIGGDNPGYASSHLDRAPMVMVAAADATATHGAATVVGERAVELLAGDYLVGINRRELGLAGDGTTTVVVADTPWRPVGAAHFVARVRI